MSDVPDASVFAAFAALAVPAPGTCDDDPKPFSEWIELSRGAPVALGGPLGAGACFPAGAGGGGPAGGPAAQRGSASGGGATRSAFRAGARGGTSASAR